MAECLDFVESEKKTEMSETVREPRVKRKNNETNVCLPMTLREMLG